jgi:hypothetical protein
MSTSSSARQLSQLHRWTLSELFAPERQHAPANDVGGRLIEEGLVSRAGELLHIPSVAVPPLASPDHVARRTLEAMHDIYGQSWVAVARVDCPPLEASGPSFWMRTAAKSAMALAVQGFWRQPPRSRNSLQLARSFCGHSSGVRYFASWRLTDKC